MLDFRTIPAFCINLDSRPDRRMLAELQFKALGWPVTRVPAVMASYPEGFDATARWIPGQPLMPGQAACTASHRRAWAMAMESDSEMVAFFEDDALFPSDFDEVFKRAYEELPSDWRLWHLHSFGPNQEITSRKVGNFVTLLSSNGYGSHGYLIRRSLMEEMLASPPSANEPVDWLLTVGMASKGKKVYGTANEKALCFQRVIRSNIKETSVSEYYMKMIKLYYR